MAVKPSKKCFALTLSLLACSSAFAVSSFTTNNLSMQLQPKSNYMYVNAGVGTYFADFPVYNSGLVDRSYPGRYLLSTSFNSIYPVYYLGAGYDFINDNGLFTSIFGNRNSVELDFSAVKNGTSTTTNQSGEISIVDILSGVSILQNVDNVHLVSVSLASKLQQYDGALLWKGNKLLGSHIVMHPVIGPRVIENHQNYNMYMDYETIFPPPFPAAPDADKEITNLRTNYKGLEVGDSFSYNSQGHFIPSAGLNVSFMAANSNLDATQQSAFITAPDLQVDIHTGTHAFLSYIISPTAAISYYFTHKATSPSLTLSAGLDYWSWVPEIVQAGPEAGHPLHIQHTDMTDGDVGLTLTVPLT